MYFLYSFFRSSPGYFTGIAWCASKGPLLIGAQRDDGLFFDGDVGEVRVYRRALNSAEVEALSKLDTDAASTQSCSPSSEGGDGNVW